MNILFGLYFGFHAWCFNQAWNNNAAFVARLDKIDKYFYTPNFFSIGLITLLLTTSIGGFIFSWFQH